MPDPAIENPAEQARSMDGARAVLRVPEILIAVAAKREGSGFAELREELGLPKSSLHRLLRTLEQSGYLVQRSGLYLLGPQSARLVRKIGGALPPEDLPSSARPILEWLARETSESIILAVLAEGGAEVCYVDVINSEKPLRFTVPSGNRRPLYAAASGQAILAFLPREEQERYIAHAEFVRLTADTLGPEELARKLPAIAQSGVVFDRNGSFPGAGAVASPCFDRDGKVQCSVSIAGPIERIDEALERLQRLTLEAGERISRLLGYSESYPPRP